MTTTLYAQSYDLSATGFSFETAEDYEAKAANAVNEFGQKVEEFEIQFIDGAAIDCALVEAWGLHQGNIAAFLEAVDEWDEDRKQRFIIVVGECGYARDEVLGDPDLDMVDIYHVSSLRELAMSFVEEGLFGDIPERVSCYLDYDAIARDLAMDYGETVIAGETLIYRCD